MDHHFTQVLDDYDLLQHVNVLTHIDEGILNLIITLLTKPHVMGIHVEGMGFPDPFIISTIASARPDPVCQTCETRNFKAFRSKFQQSAVYTAPCTDMNGFVDLFRDNVVSVLDKLVPLRRMTKRCGKPSNKWLSSEAILARQNTRQLECHYGRTCSEFDSLAYREACRITNCAFKESQRKHDAKKLVDTKGDSRGWWRVIKGLFYLDERLITKDAMENQTICDDYQRFFADKIAKIAKKIKSITNSGSLPPQSQNGSSHT